MTDAPDFDDLPFPAVPLQTRKLIQTAEEIAINPAEEAEFLHTILCQCGLPRSKVAGETFERKSGAASLLLEAGRIADGKGNWNPAPLPYGAKPRLMLYHLCSEAVRTKSPYIDVGGSVRGFLERIGIDYMNQRTLSGFKQQMLALAACRMTLAFWDNGRVRQVKADPIKAFDAWFPLDPEQKAFWSDRITLGQEFFETLCEHAIPLDPRAIHALQHSALALDVYTWMANRLCRVKRGGQMVSWKNLRVQFGQEYRTSKDFKRDMKKALMKARAVYPAARIEEVIGGIKIHPSPPPIPKRQVVVGGRFMIEGKAKKLGR